MITGKCDNYIFNYFTYNYHQLDFVDFIYMQGEVEKSKECCCPAGAWPALQTDYQPKGQTLQIGSGPVYHVGSGKKAIVIISDIFGAFSGRHQAVADTFSTLGYEVFIPEVLSNPFKGELGPAIMENIKSQDFNLTRERFGALAKHLAAHGHQKFYLIGFCWGVWACFKLSAEFNCIISIAGMHPSLRLQEFFGGNQIQLTKSINAPAFLYPAQNDPPNIKVGGQIIAELEKKFGADKVGTLQFPDMQHGWVVRGDLKDEKVYRDTQKALKLAVEYFNKFQ